LIYHRNRRRGVAQIYAIIVIMTLMAICSLAVDLGRVQLVKTEMRRMCDAAARSAVTGVTTGTAYAKAAWVAGQNPVDAATLALAPADVEVGRWDIDAAVFQPNVAPPNAVRVTARRTAATNNAIPTVLAGVIGISTVDVTVQSVAMIKFTGYGVVGLNFIAMVGNASDSYWSRGGTAGSTTSSYDHGSIASNGNIYLTGSSSIAGDVRPGVGMGVFGASRVTGSIEPLKAPLSFPNGNAGSSVTSNQNSSVPSQFMSYGGLKVPTGSNLTLPGGNYYFNNVEVGGTLKFSGPATIYSTGTFVMYGNADTSGNQPGNLKIVMCPTPSGTPPGFVSIGSSSALYASIYAPQSHVILAGTGDIYGSVLGLSVTMTGTSSIHYDLSLDANNGSISMVQ
jgi:hypothetical protein